MLQLQFESNQQHQLDAIRSIGDALNGLPRQDAAPFALSANVVAAGNASAADDGIIGNLSEFEELDRSLLLDNLLTVQRANDFNSVDQADRLEWEDGQMLDVFADGARRAAFPNYTLEMETGTGKTYVYLRSVFDLNTRYGLRKFVVVVPSVAIYEGVRKSYDIMRGHLRALYGNAVVNLIEYDGAQLGKVGSFARSSHCEILLITLDAFNKASNVIYKNNEKLPGALKPIEYIQRTRPIVIMDEPQKMEGEAALKAICTLNPLLTLRFSATHRQTPNRLFRLTPIDAFRRNLVKKIQVIGVSERENLNLPILAVRDIVPHGSSWRAIVRTLVTKDGKTTETDIQLGPGDDVYKKTNRSAFANTGYVVANIVSGGDGFVEFENGVVIGQRDAQGDSKRAIYRAQIIKTLEEHFKVQADLRPHGIKVLSLFFIDRVASYTHDDGVIRRLFDEEFNRLKQDSAYFRHLPPEAVRAAYFAKKKKAKAQGQNDDGDDVVSDLEALNAKERQAAEQAAYQLIMRDKERLLSFDSSACFIFAHSALREGWDNPNVFQICTLRESASEIDRRQSIGRGLRLCVNQNGERVLDDSINVLTVIANESYRAFASGLQSEYQKSGDIAPPAPKNPRANEAIRRDEIYHAPFQAFWQKLRQPLRYKINIDTPVLIETAIARLNQADFPRSVIVVERGMLALVNNEIKVVSIGATKAELQLTLLDRKTGELETRTRAFKPSDLIHQVIRDDELKPFGNFRIEMRERQPVLVFGNGVILGVGDTHSFSPANPGQMISRASLPPARDYPVFNLIARVANEVGITKPSINAIFAGMREDKRKLIFKNPEGFANVFITEVRNAVADHIAERIEFETSTDLLTDDPDEIFPRIERYPQKEVVEAGNRGLYDLVQTDSEVEREFVKKLKEDGKVEFYFKFPSRFRVHLPKLIGNYNPDWGIARLDQSGQPVIHKLRETKGGDIEKLQFPAEKRKIKCARKYFAALGIDYRPIHPAAMDTWWLSEAEQPQLSQV